MAQYTVRYEVTRDTVSPATPQNGGRYGDKAQTVLTFHPTFSGAAAYQYRLEITDGAGGYDVTALAPLQNGTVSFTVPAAWTVPGVATLHLVAVETNGNAEETERFHSAPAYLYFENRDNGDTLWEATDSAWQAVMTQAVRTAQQASAAASLAETRSGQSEKHAAAAQTAAENAKQQATTAVEAATAAQAAGEAAEQAATDAAVSAAHSAENAASAVNQVEPFALRAEEAAASADEDAEACDALLLRCEELCGTAEDIAALAGDDGGIEHPCVTVDTALDSHSQNPVANAAVAAALAGTASLSHSHSTGHVTCDNTGYWWGTSGTVEDALLSISGDLASLHSGQWTSSAANITTNQQGGTVEDSLAGLWATKVSASSLSADTVPFAYSGAPLVSTVADALKLLFGKVGM